MPAYRERAVDGRMHFLGASLEEYARSGPLATMAARRGVAVPPITSVDAGDPIPAILDDDRWVVLCPDCRRNAQMAWLDQPLFFCGNCFNALAGGRWRPVAFPADRLRIEAVLGERPFSHQRNWRGESVDDLVAEAATNGVAPPPVTPEVTGGVG